MSGYKSSISTYEGMGSEFAECVMAHQSECIRLEDLMTKVSCHLIADYYHAK